MLELSKNAIVDVFEMRHLQKLFYHSAMTVEMDVCVVGAGVVGLACARSLAMTGRNVVLLERHGKFGQETSSRNSEVIHSGIYYPKDSLKTALCIRGRELLYDYCKTHQIPFRKSGKFVVATEKSDLAYLEKLKAHSDGMDVPCEEVSSQEVKSREPLVECQTALFFSESGIVDSHRLMESLERDCVQHGVVFAYRNTVREVSPGASGWQVRATGPDGEIAVHCGVLINAAGLGAAALAEQNSNEKVEHRFCRGRYFSAAGRLAKGFQHLVYPVPPKDGLGIHVTVDLEGLARFGPDVDWCDGLAYSQMETALECDWDALRPGFLTSIQRYCPSVRSGDLLGGFTGIRPKLFVQGKAHPDFWIHRTADAIHLLGIESPGLTASLALAEEVARLAV